MTTTSDNYSTKRRTCILILGMHRSGTSALAGSLNVLGYEVGRSIMEAKADNPKGFFENQEIYNFNEKLLDKLNLAWHDTFFLVDKWWEDKSLTEFKSELQSILTDEFRDFQKFIIKDPRLNVLLPFYNDVLRLLQVNVKVIISVRNPIEVSDSLIKRNNLSQSKSLLLWTDANLKAELYSRKRTRVFLCYNDLLNNPVSTLKKTFELLRLSVKIDKEDEAEILSFLDKTLKHNSFNIDLKEHKQIHNLFKLLVDSNLKESSKINVKRFDDLATSFYSDLFFFHGLEQEITFTIKVKGDGFQKTYMKQIKKSGIQMFTFDKSNPVSEIIIYPIRNKVAIVIDSISAKVSDGKMVSLEVSDTNAEKISEAETLYIFDSDFPWLKINLLQPIQIVEFWINAKYVALSDNVYRQILKTSNIIEEENKNKLITVENALDTANNEILLLKNNVTQLITNSNQLASTNQVLSESISKISNEKEQLFNNMKESNTDNKGLKNELEQTKLTIDQLSAEKENLKQKLNDLQKAFEEKELKRITHINELENANQSSINRAKQLDDLINEIVASRSWKIGRTITWPIRKPKENSKTVLKKVKSLGFDIKMGFGILKRDGLKEFLYRFRWYLKGVNLRDEIEIYRDKIENRDKNDIKPQDFTEPIDLPVYLKPLVSIIIPVYNQWHYTYKCIKSIKDNTDVEYEIILIDDVSTDETVNADKIISNLKVLRNKNNLGFLKNCNKAAKYAKGEYIHILNNDTVVHKGWMSSLINVFNNYKYAGLVGSKLLFSDGKLQEAGGIVWNDASGWNYGRGDNPEKPEYNYVKEVDYVSGASFLIKKELWEELNGFDELFTPAYYEDTDMAFRIREKGLKVYYQPLSVITHFEGVSNGKELTTGIKKYQKDNLIKFHNRWKKTLEIESKPNAQDVFLRRDRSDKKKQVVVIDHYVPHFDQDAGSRSTFSYIKLLVKIGCNVKFIGDNFYKYEPYTSILQQMGVEVLYGTFYQKNLWDWFEINGKYFNYIITHRIHIAPKYFKNIKKYSDAKIAYVGHDLEFLSSLKKYEFTGDENFKQDSKKFKKIESDIFNAVDIILPFSIFEAPYIKALAPSKIVKTIPVYFFDNPKSNIPDFSKRKDLLFVAFFGHPPNEDALLWFVNNVFDIIKSKMPEIKLYVVGSKPTDKVLALQSDSIIVTGYVSDEELDIYYRKTKVAVIPLRFGAGVKGKLLEALNYQLPNVITSVAAEGVPEIEKYTMIADEPKDFAQKVINLYSDESLWFGYSKKGREIINKYFKEEAAGKIFKQLFNISA